MTGNSAFLQLNKTIKYYYNCMIVLTNSQTVLNRQNKVNTIWLIIRFTSMRAIKSGDCATIG